MYHHKGFNSSGPDSRRQPELGELKLVELVRLALYNSYPMRHLIQGGERIKANDLSCLSLPSQIGSAPCSRVFELSNFPFDVK